MTDNKVLKWIPLVMLLAFVLTMLVPRWIDQQICMKFGEPLFAYPLPEGSSIVSQDGARDDDGVITAAILIKTDLTSEELAAYYGNLEMNPAKNGQNIEILAKPLSENDLEVLKQAKIYEEGANYQFVYARSR